MAVQEILEGKVAIVTGATHGIGKALAVALGEMGANVILNARDVQILQDVATLVDPTNKRVAYVTGDISRRTIPEKKADERIVSPTLYAPADEMVGYAKEVWGRVDIAIHAAGVTRDNLFARQTDEEWDEVMRTKVEGARNLLKAVQRPMTVQRSGIFIALTSIAGEGNPGQSNYAAANMAVEAMILSVDRETRAEVRIRALRLGPVDEGLMWKLRDESPKGYQVLSDRMPDGKLIPVSAVVDKVFDMITGHGEDPIVHVFDGGFRRE